MAITNGYCTLAEWKYYQAPRGQTLVTDANDDTVIEDMIEAASRYIDRETRRTFYARTETRYFDLPPDSDRLLKLDDDLLTITTLTNGDGVVLTTTYYSLVPKNDAPYYGIKIKETSTYNWTYDAAGNSENVISVAGTWGYSATTPDDIKQACLLISGSMYKRRYGENLSSVSTITAAGIMITPQDVPALAAQIIKGYKRVV